MESKGNRLQQKDLKFCVAGEFIMSFTPDAYVLFLLFVCHIETTHVLPGTNDVFTYYCNWSHKNQLYSCRLVYTIPKEHMGLY